MAFQKVELEQRGSNAYRVVRLTNRLEPTVGTTITVNEVKSLLDSARKGKMDVVINSRKGD